MGIVKLLLHFRWTWVGFFAADNNDGERFMRTLRSAFTRSGICIAFSHAIPVLTLYNDFSSVVSFLLQCQANVIIYNGDSQSMLGLTFVMKHIQRNKQAVVGKVWITTALRDVNVSIFYNIFDLQNLHACFSFLTQQNKRRRYGTFPPFYSSIYLYARKAFDCLDTKPALTVKARTRCREKPETLSREMIERSLALDGYNIYATIQALIQSLNEVFLSRASRMFSSGGNKWAVPRVQPWQVPFSGGTQ